MVYRIRDLAPYYLLSSLIGILALTCAPLFGIHPGGNCHCAFGMVILSHIVCHFTRPIGWARLIHWYWPLLAKRSQYYPLLLMFAQLLG